VSAHLSRPRAAGLVTARRTGPVVLYARTALAEQWVAGNAR
jgi:DNA-binding transcriptional ArsR family regulator